MKDLTKIVPAARALGRAGAAAALATGTYGLYRWQARRTTDLERLRDDHARRLGRRMLRVLGVETRVLGTVPPRRRGVARLVVANHRAATDIGALLALFGGTLVARADMAEWPLVGPMSRAVGTIFVDRADERSGARAIRAIRARLRAGDSVSVFAEGATFVGDNVRPFRPGAFAAARGLEVELVPVGIAVPPGLEYVGLSFGEHVRRVARRRRTPVALAVGEARSLTEAARVEAERAREEVTQLVRRAREALDSDADSMAESGPVPGG